MAKKLNQRSSMPKLNAVFGWSSLITIVKIIQTNVNYELVETEQKITFKGVVQPLKAEDVQLKPEGQRAFQWLQIHCVAGSLNLKKADNIVYNNKTYKVMGIQDYSLNGYIEYHCIEDFKNE